MGGKGSGGQGFPELTGPTKPPYQSTKIPVEDSQRQIDRLLQLYGIRKIGWLRNEDQISLTFATTIEIDGEKRELSYRFNPPLFAVERKTWNKEKGTYETLPLPNLAAGMRLLFDYLKNKLAAVFWGVVPFEEEFLSEMLIPTREGVQTYAQYVKKAGLVELPNFDAVKQLAEEKTLEKNP